MRISFKMQDRSRIALFFGTHNENSILRIQQHVEVSDVSRNIISLLPFFQSYIPSIPEFVCYRNIFKFRQSLKICGSVVTK